MFDKLKFWNTSSPENFVLTDGQYKHHVKQLTKLQRALSNLSGISVTHNEDLETLIEQSYGCNSDVYSIISLVASVAKRIPWEVYKVKNRKAFNRYKSLSPAQKINNPLIAFGAKKSSLVEADDDNPISRLMETPNPQMEFADLIENWVGFQMLTGEVMTYASRRTTGDKGSIMYIYPVAPQIMEAVPGGDEFTGGIKGWKISLDPEAFFPAKDIGFRKNFNPDRSAKGSHLRGMSPLKVAARPVKASNKGYDALLTILDKLGALGLLSLKESKPGFSETMAKQMEKRYKAKSTGSKNFGDIVFSDVSWEWVKIGMNVSEMQIPEMSKFSLQKLCSVWHVPYLLFTEDSATYNNMDKATKSLYTNAVFPIMDVIKSMLNGWLLGELDLKGQYYIDYDIQAIPELMGDMEKLVKMLKDSYWLQLNECREYSWWPADTENDFANSYFIPANLVEYGGTRSDGDREEAKKLQEQGISDYYD